MNIFSRHFPTINPAKIKAYLQPNNDKKSFDFEGDALINKGGPLQISSLRVGELSLDASQPVGSDVQALFKENNVKYEVTEKSGKSYFVFSGNFELTKEAIAEFFARSKAMAATSPSAVYQAGSLNDFMYN